MPIQFSKDQWDKVKHDAQRWWNHDLKRPLIQVRLRGADAGRPEPDLPDYAFDAFYDFSVSEEQIIERRDHELSSRRYLGDAFPAVWPNFGPGVMAAFAGANLKCSTETCWFQPKERKPLSELNMEYDPDNFWYQRVKKMCQAAIDRWEDQVQVATTDLGGNLDVLSTFRPGQELLLDLYDHPEDVKARTWDVHRLWWQYFDELNGILQPQNPGYTAWSSIFSDTPFYMLQCDFAYMIGPDMFDEFVKPELEATCKRLDHSFYHLDGPGQLAHLDSLLSIPELDGIQWVPGAGNPDECNWPEVYKKIRDAGKLIHLQKGLKSLISLADQIGTAEGIVTMHGAHISEKDEIEEVMRSYGVG